MGWRKITNMRNFLIHGYMRKTGRLFLCTLMGHHHTFDEPAHISFYPKALPGSSARSRRVVRTERTGEDVPSGDLGSAFG